MYVRIPIEQQGYWKTQGFFELKEHYATIGLDGKTVTGIPTRATEETPTRIDALRLYTEGSAWFAFDDARRGSLAVGKLAVLTEDYLTIPAGQIGDIRSLLTMVGGRIVYASEPYARSD